MEMQLAEALFLGVWAFVGSTLGYFTFSFAPEKKPHEKFCRWVLSVGVGLFLAFPIWIYLRDHHTFSQTLDIMIAGLCAFGLPDFIMKHWATIMQTILDVVLNILSSKKRG